MYSGEHIGSPLRIIITQNQKNYGKQSIWGKILNIVITGIDRHSNHFRYHVLYRRIVKKREDEIRFILSVYKAISNFPFLSILHW